jgi:hypothetical protein
MSSRPITLRRLGVAAVAVATVAAGLPMLVGTAANAAAPTRLVLSQDNTRTSAAAGTCTAFTVTATDPFGTAADAATITVTIAEAPETNNHDVDFCLVDGGTPFAAAPRYDNEPILVVGNEPPPTANDTQQYDAGPGITTVASDSPPATGGSDAADTDNPDSADDAGGSGPGGTQTSGTNANNPDGVDQASFRSVGGIVRFGVVGLLPGASATIDAFVDNGTQFTRNNDSDADLEDNVVAAQRRVLFTAGGLAGSVAVNDAVTRVDLLPEESIAAKTSDAGAATHTFTLQAFNTNGDVVGNVSTARLVATSGPNAPASTGTTNGSGTGTCTSTGNEGEPATCTYTATQPGTDTVTGFVNQSTGAPTPGLDATEPRDTATAITTPPATTNTATARTLVLTPDQATIVAGQSRDFTAAVTDANGAPVNGVSIRFDENGPGAFQSPTSANAATSTVVLSTTGTGRATVRFLTSSTDRGTNTITATIITTGTQCASGTCSDSSPVTITASGSPSPSPSATGSPRPTASATPTATISPRPTSSTSSSPNQACSTPASVSLDVTTITATGGANVTVRGAADSVVDLFAYSRPSSTYRLVRSGNVGSDGAETYRITPPTNTRLYAQQRGCTTDEPRSSRVLNVRTQISLNVVRNGVRNYTFSGRLLPARPNGLIASLYRVEASGRQILTAQTRANAAPGQAGYDPRRPPGSYSIRRQFTGSGRFGFVVRTGQDLQNAPGSSNVRSLLVF